MRSKIKNIISMILIFIMGLFLVYWSNKNSVLFSGLLGGLFIIYGISLVREHYKYDDNSFINLVSAFLSIIIGAMILLKSSVIFEILSLILGIFILIIVIENISALLRYKGNNFGLNIGIYIFSILVALICIFGNAFIPNVLFNFLGIILIVYSVCNFVNCFVSP